jgi:hypothetical protein
VNSTNPSSGVAITVSPADNNSAASGTTSFTRTYDAGTSVTLTAPAASGSNTFTSWTGCTSSSTVTCTVAMSANTIVTANYASTAPTIYTLTVNSTNPASGVAITNSPADNNSLTGGNTSYTLTYNSGATVTLTAPATASGNTFANWVGCTSSSTVTCTVTMSANTTVTANFFYTLTVNSTNPASGVLMSITNPPSTISSQKTTSFTMIGPADFAYGLVAPATAPNGNTFSSWSGCTSSSGTTCNVTLSANTTVTANYAVPVTTYTLAVNSTNPASGVAITNSPADNNSLTGGNTSYILTYNSGATVTLIAPANSGANAFTLWSGGCTSTTVTCNVTMSANTTVTANYTTSKTTPTVTVTPSASSITVAQPLTVTVALSGSPTPTGTVVLTSGTYTSASTTLSSGGASINIPAGALATATDTLTVSYTPDVASAVTYNSSTGTSSVTVTASALIAPTVTVTPATSTITTSQSLNVTVAVSGGSGKLIPTGFVNLTSGTYSSGAKTLSGGTAQVDIPAGSLATGSDTLSVTYTPDSSSSSTYKTSSGTSSAVTVSAATLITVNQSSSGPAVTNQILGMNLAMWYDDSSTTNAPNIETAFTAAGIKAVRWPGGSNSDLYNWETNTECGGYTVSTDDFTDFIDNLVKPAGYDLALTADYGTGKNCTGAGDPTEAAAWAAEAVTLGVPVHYMTVGNEEYGSWEKDNHTKEHDAPTYAAAVAGSSGYYALIKAASPTTLVGVDVNPGNSPAWDPTVLADAPYDFVEYHYYVFNPGNENDSTLVNAAAQTLTRNINTIKSELTTAGKSGTPIYVGEIGSVSSNPGKQSWSITQGLYAGQALGEMMNDGVVRLTWWIGFGNCNNPPYTTPPNNSASLYGWQDFGAYNVFSDGPSDTDCPGAGPLGTMSPTAQAFSLFQNVAVTGETVLTATVGGDTADVVAYAATHSGGTALVLFNRNETTAEPVAITLTSPSKTSSTGVTVITYDKATYDLSGSPTGFFPDPVGTSTWAGPTTTNLGAQALPLTVTLTPWSMNVFIIK